MPQPQRLLSYSGADRLAGQGLTEERREHAEIEHARQQGDKTDHGDDNPGVSVITNSTKQNQNNPCNNTDRSARLCLPENPIMVVLLY